MSIEQRTAVMELCEQAGTLLCKISVRWLHGLDDCVAAEIGGVRFVVDVYGHVIGDV